MSVNNSLPLNASTAQLPLMHQQNLTTASFYTIITVNIYQLNITTECSYSVITANLNTNLPPYIYKGQPKPSAKFLSCNDDTDMVSA